jgi:NDP-sugar pyrophosphorylase family protein
MTYKENDMQAMIFAAGLGTRLKPLTDRMPKALVEVGGKPLLWHVIEKLKGAGAKRIVVNVHHFASQIEDYLAQHYFGIDIKTSDETQMLLETGGGIKKAIHLFDSDSPVLIHNVDILSNVDLASFYSHSMGHDATLLVSERKTKRYLLFDDDMKLMGWTNIETGEVRTPYNNLDLSKCHRYAFSGIHVFSPKLAERMSAYPDKFGIIDFYLKECATADIRGMLKSDLRLMDVGKLDTLQQADDFLNSL